jgi:hypothetical protein
MVMSGNAPNCKDKSSSLVAMGVVFFMSSLRSLAA